MKPFDKRKSLLLVYYGFLGRLFKRLALGRGRLDSVPVGTQVALTYGDCDLENVV